MDIERARKRLVEALDHSAACDELFRGGQCDEKFKSTINGINKYGVAVLDACKRRRAQKDPCDDKWVDLLSPESEHHQRMRKAYRFLTQPELLPYMWNLKQVPRMVNVVTLAYVKPRPGSDTTIPIDLHRVAARCNGAYFSPRKFAAVQLAYATPRARVLVFRTPSPLAPHPSKLERTHTHLLCIIVVSPASADTGRLVGTGTTGVASARCAILLAIRQLADEAGVFLSVTDFSVINSVGACNLHTTIACNAFANKHSSEVHYDRSSFVGLAWRPPNVPISVELYSTGRCNIPRALSEHELRLSFAKLLPELMRFRSELYTNGEDNDHAESDSDMSESVDGSESSDQVVYNDNFWDRLRGFDIDVNKLKTQMT